MSYGKKWNTKQKKNVEWVHLIRSKDNVKFTKRYFYNGCAVRAHAQVCVSILPYKCLSHGKAHSYSDSPNTLKVNIVENLNGP